MSSRSLFTPVGKKPDQPMRYAGIMKELYIDTSPDVFGVPANACFVLLNYRLTAVGNPQAYITAMSEPCHTACPHCSPGKDRQLWCAQAHQETAAMQITYLIPSFSRRSHMDWLIIV